MGGISLPPIFVSIYKIWEVLVYLPFFVNICKIFMRNML